MRDKRMNEAALIYAGMVFGIPFVVFKVWPFLMGAIYGST